MTMDLNSSTQVYTTKILKLNEFKFKIHLEQWLNTWQKELEPQTKEYNPYWLNNINKI